MQKSQRNTAMPLLESIKEKVEKVTGWARPSRRDLVEAVRPRKPNAFRFADDGVIPNNPDLPFIFYQTPVRLVKASDPAALFEELFARNGWKDFWRNGTPLSCGRFPADRKGARYGRQQRPFREAGW
jgi:hypothetical protein